MRNLTDSSKREQEHIKKLEMENNLRMKELEFSKEFKNKIFIFKNF